MDSETHAEVTSAIDVAIARVAETEIARLSIELSDEQITKNICDALRELEGLQKGLIPNYCNEWIAVFYLLWYQPAQINLAYTLVRAMPESISPIVTGGRDLQVFDFGCGALATKFGLALATAEAWQHHQRPSKITIHSDDKSGMMKRIGRQLWKGFANELKSITRRKGDSKLEDLSRACDEGIHDGKIDSRSGPLWLTALHTAYEENAARVNRALEAYVNLRQPDLVLVTSNPAVAVHRFRPQCGYRCWGRKVFKWTSYSHDPHPDRLELRGKLCNTSAFRLRLYERIRDSLEDSESDYVHSKLADPTLWTGRTELEAAVYVREP